MTNEGTVFIVDDHASVRDSLCDLLDSVGLRTAAFSNCEEFLKAYTEDAPGCLLLDIRMPGMGGMELLESLARRNIHLPVIIISGHGDVPLAVQAMRLGAVDFLEKPLREQVLLDRVRLAIARDAQARQERARRVADQARLATLTPREREVLQLLVNGVPPKAVARRLEISRKTLHVHRSNLMRKMGTDSLVELVLRAAPFLAGQAENLPRQRDDAN